MAMPLIQLFLSFLRYKTLREKWIRNIHRDYFEVDDKTVVCIRHFGNTSEVIQMGKFKKGKHKTLISKVESSDKQEENSGIHKSSRVKNYDHGKGTINFSSSTVPFKSKEDTSLKQIPTKISVLPNSRRILKCQTLKKTFKRKLRHTVFISELNHINVRAQEANQAEKALRKRRQTPIVGDLQPLVNALPTIKASKPVLKVGKVRKQPHGGICKSQERQESMLQDIAVFQNVLNDPQYQADPAACISKLIQSRMLEEK